MRAAAGLPGRLDGPAEVDVYAQRGREGGAQVEPTDLPNLRAHTGDGGGGQHEFIHDRRDPACVHPDAVGRDGTARTPSEDAEGSVRLRDAGLGVIDDGTSYTLSTGAPPVVGPVPIQDGRDRSKKDQNGLGVGGEGDPAYTLDTTGGQAVGQVSPQAFLPRAYTRGKDGEASGTVPALTKESDRGDGQAVVYGFTSTLGSLDADGIEEDAVPPLMARTPPAACIPDDEDVLSPLDAQLAGRLERDGYLPPVPIDPQPDGPRYAAMGDAVTVHVSHWIAEGIRSEAEAHGGLYAIGGVA